ncbi:hypothetical protein [Bacillus benzoevorans]|uniref:DNA-directed RNA polymerase subunit RPC12/RpoP n=1 Tax=Bacillus benzoevorans TaxID=1456 RepID=A0A7X0LWQ6_9BACI|nr:hypothetical protein [Bacillus benzoevorans]MBB6445634.1 DNA-directed RNA polymerase subunit RPC12/RpoP [Bacillus benzoevorans]
MDSLDKLIVDYIEQQEGLTEEEIMIKAQFELIIPMQIISKFEEWKNKRRFYFNKDDNHDNYEYVSKLIREEMLEIIDDADFIVNTLVKHYYDSEKPNIGGKKLLWDVFGDVLYSNIKENTKGTKSCDECGDRFEPTKQRQTKCPSCQEKIKKEKARLRKIKFNEKKKNNQ